MPKVRILVVDDAVVVRSRVGQILSSDPDLEVVGTAANGRIALAKIPHLNPDIVILDVEMPEMDGLETLAAIRQLYPKLPVIMFSTSTSAGAKATLEALALGATDYATKPSHVGRAGTAHPPLCEDLIFKIKLFGLGAGSAAVPQTVLSPLPIAQPHRIEPIEAIAIGVSTGGPNALAEVLSALPPDLPVPILIVQHMPPMFTMLLAERLDSKCQIQVKEAYAGAILEPSCAWIAPGNYHMVVQRQGVTVQIATHQAPPQNSCRPSTDVLFRSVAQVYGARVLGVVLTGMGQDGLQGCHCIREAGGQILAQDQASSVVWGMPGFVANAGLADQVVPLSEMAEEILRRVYDSPVPRPGRV